MKGVFVRMMLNYVVFSSVCGVFCLTASSIMPVTLIERVPMVPDGPLVLPLSTTELKEYQDICIIEGCDKPIFNPGNKPLNLLYLYFYSFIRS